VRNLLFVGGAALLAANPLFFKCELSDVIPNGGAAL